MLDTELDYWINVSHTKWSIFSVFVACRYDGIDLFGFIKSVMKVY